MQTNEKLNEVLNDLVRINNDRITGYEKAAEETKDIEIDLKAIFHKMADESRKYVSELNNEIIKYGGEPAEGTTGAGKIYRVWMDVKATFTGHDRQSALDSCEFGEDAAQKAYKDALASDAEISADTRQMITTQQSSLKSSHDAIKKLRDAQESVNAM
ncbi:MAG: PA2169 family four-helix-bundle protein [Ferruginibacter sp.]